MSKRGASLCLLLLWCLLPPLGGQSAHPHIWVSDADRAGVLARTATYPEVAAYYIAFTERVDREIEHYTPDPLAYLQQLPYDWDRQTDGAIPPLLT